MVTFMTSALLCYLGWQGFGHNKMVVKVINICSQTHITLKNMSLYVIMVTFLRLKSLTVDCKMVLSQIFTILATISQQPAPTTNNNTAGVCAVCAGFISTAEKKHKQ